MKDLINANQVAIKDIGQSLQLLAQRIDRLEDSVKVLQEMVVRLMGERRMRDTKGCEYCWNGETWDTQNCINGCNDIEDEGEE